MTLWDLIKYTFWIGVLVLITTGLSFLDRDSSYHQSRLETNIETQLAASPDAVERKENSISKGGEGEEEGGGEEAIEIPSIETFIESQQPPVFPLRNWNVSEPKIPARSALVIDPETNQHLYVKNKEESLPIASITKLMTALVILENLDMGEVAEVSKEAVATEGEAGNLIVGEEILVRDLLFALLIESSNDAAFALEEHVNRVLSPKTLVEEMNTYARNFGLSHSFFRSPSGLDFKGEASNSATAKDLAFLMKIAWEHSFIREAVSTKFLTVSSIDGRFAHYLGNSNRLLGVRPEMLGGKTGYTDLANESLVSVISSPSGEGNLIIVVLQTDDRERDTEILMDWVKQAYIWK